MVNATLAKTGMSRPVTSSTLATNGPYRTTNRDFLHDFHMIYHGRDDMESMKKTGTGTGALDFELHGTFSL